MPESGLPPLEERAIVATYEFDSTIGDSEGDGLARRVLVPTSRDGLTVLSVESNPPALKESFDGDGRWLHSTATSMTVRCRYRIAPRRSPNGSWLPLPNSEELFPGATRIHVVSSEPVP